MKRRYYWLLTSGLFFLLPQLALALPANPLNFTPPATDLSVIFLGNIFGIVGTVLHGGPSQIMGAMFGVFNSAVLALGGIVLIYTLVVSTMNTANEGEMLGKKWSSIWIPVRSVAGVALLLPGKTGYCMMQVFVMWMIIQGVGAADKVWDAALGYLQRGGVIIQPSTTQKADTGPVLNAAGSMLRMEVCMRGLERVIKQQREYYFTQGSCSANSSDWWCKQVPSFATTIDFTSLLNSPPAAGTQQTQSFPNFDSTSHPQYARYFNGICGTVSWSQLSPAQIKNVTDYLSQDPDPSQDGGSVLGANKGLLTQVTQAKAVALQQMHLDLSQAADKMVQNTLVAPASERLPYGIVKAYEAPDPSAESGVGARVSAGVSINLGGLFGSGPNDTRYLWISPVANLAPLMQGTELKGAVSDYDNLMLPTLRALKLATSDPKAVGSAFINRASTDGWLMAGSYYFNLVQLNTAVGKINVTASGFNVTDKSNSIIAQLGNQTRASGLAFLTQSYRTSLNNLLNSSVTGSHSLGAPAAKGQSLPASDMSYVAQASKMVIRGTTGTKTPDFTLHSNFKPQQIAPLPGKTFHGGFFDIPGFVTTLIYNVILKNVFNVFIFLTNMILTPIFEIIFSPMILAFEVFTAGLQAAMAKSGNPITAIAVMGNQMIDTGATIWMIAMMAFLALGGVPILGIEALVLFAFIGPIYFLFLTMVFTSGVMFAYYVPFIPYITYTYASIGWFISVIEAMVAAPLVALGIMHPEGHEAFGKSDNAIMLMLNVFLRPPMMVIGLIAGIILSYVGIYVLNTGFLRASSGMLGTTNFIGTLIGGFFVLGIYLMMYVGIIQKAFELIYLLPDKVLRWIGGGLQDSFGADAAKDAGAIKGAVSGAGEQLGRAGTQAKPGDMQEKGGKDLKGEKGSDKGGASSSGEEVLVS